MLYLIKSRHTMTLYRVRSQLKKAKAIPGCICWKWHLYCNCVCCDARGKFGTHFQNHFGLEKGIKCNL